MLDREGPPLWLVLCLVLVPACTASSELVREEVEFSAEERSCGVPVEADVPPGTAPLVRVEVQPKGSLRLHFPRVGPEAALQRFTREDARRVLKQFHENLDVLRQQRRLVASSTLVALGMETEAVEETLLREYTARYGEPTVPLPGSLMTSPLVMALRLSPRYMPEGIREGAEELFSDPAFLAGMAISLVAYVAAWAAPEPLFTKAFAVSVTVVMVSAFTLTELAHAGGAAMRLYEATRNIRTLAEVEEAARYFGLYAGGVTLRVLVVAASWGVAKVVPKPVPGGAGETWAGLKNMMRLPQRFAVEGSVEFVEEAATRTVRAGVKEGVLLMQGAMAGGTGASLRAACRDGLYKLSGYSWHHLATNKNSISDARGGPWTKRFKILFAKAGMSLEDAPNKVYLLGHAGPHPEDYHDEVFSRLRDAVSTCRTTHDCKVKLTRELSRIADEVCTPGSKLHQLVTSP